MTDAVKVIFEGFECQRASPASLEAPSAIEAEGLLRSRERVVFGVLAKGEPVTKLAIVLGFS